MYVLDKKKSKPHFFYIRVGFKGVYIAHKSGVQEGIHFPDGRRVGCHFSMGFDGTGSALFYNDSQPIFKTFAAVC